VHEEAELFEEVDQQRHVLHSVGTSLEELAGVVCVEGISCVLAGYPTPAHVPLT
jgi:hypothetical protein